MKIALAALFAILLTAATAAAQSESLELSSTNAPPPPPDYSRDALLRLWANSPPPSPQPQRRIEFRDGEVIFHALNTRWRFNFLPFYVPLYGTYGNRAGLRPNAAVPDGLVALGVEPPQTPRTWRDNRGINKEMRRIERTERERAKIKVSSEQ